MTVPLELLSHGPARPDLLEDLIVAEADLASTLARWSGPAPVAVESGEEAGVPRPDTVAAVLAEETPALVDVAPGLAGPGAAEDLLVQLLVAATHSGVGFGSGLVPRADHTEQVWALLAGAVAAMTGTDVRRALAAPDPAALVGLSRSAREAVRDVVTCVAVPADAVDRVVADLAAVHATDGR